MPATSQQQQKLFGLALSVKRGETPRSEASQEILDIVDSMSEKDIEDFAGTKHDGLPKKVEAQLREIVREIMRERAMKEAELPKAMIPNNIKVKLNMAIDKIKDTNLTYNQKLQVIGKIIDSLGIDRKELVKMSTRLRGTLESVNEAAGKEAMGIAAFTGTRGDAVQKFIDDNKLDAKKLFNYVKGGKLTDRLNFVTAVVGTPGNPVQKRMIKMFGESINEGKFKVDDLVYNKRTKTIGIVRMGDDKHGEVKTDADGNVSVDELEKYNPIKFKHQTKAKVAPSTEKEVNSRGLFNPFKMESVNEASYNFGKEEYTKKNLTPTQILDLAMAYANISGKGTNMYGGKMENMIKVANDLAKLNGTKQMDAKARGSQPALLLFLLKNQLVTKDEYVKLYKNLLEKQISVVKALKNADPASRMIGGAAARQAHRDMKGEFDTE